MRVVLYANDMEPITVIEIENSTYEYICNYGIVNIHVPSRPFCSVLIPSGPIQIDNIKIVSIFAERFVRNGREHRMLFTHDEESAMLLKCAFLPGQQARLQERERAAFARGIIAALNSIGE